MKVLPKGLYGITVRRWGHDHATSAKLLLEAGARIIQYREKEPLSAREMIAQAKKVKELCESYGALFIVNDRVDVAYASEADGVHVGQEDFPAGIARKMLGDAIIGVSASTVSEGVKAEEDGADYVGAGSVFPSSTKPEERILGIEGLKQLVGLVKIPVYAIGGIRLEHVRMLKGLGVAGVAVISAIFASEEPRKVARSFVEEWERE
ncbi:thiamine phosphate synthase [Tardisphaera saccharovorans]